MARSVRERASAEKIVQVAERLYQQYGYRKTTVADVAKGLGMSPANIYRFFPSKEDLRRAVFMRLLDVGYTMALDISRLRVAPASRIRRYLKTQSRMIVDIINNHSTIHELIILSLQRDEDLLSFQIRRLSSVLADVIIDGIDSGEFADQDAYESSRIFILATATLWHPVLLGNLQARWENCGDDLLAFSLGALKSGSPSPNDVML